MSLTFLYMVTFLHGAQTIGFLWGQEWALSVMLLGFTIADIGILWVALK